MAKLPTVKIEQTSIDAIFDALQVIPKTELGKFDLLDTRPPSPANSIVGTSHIVKHFRRPNGFHIATSHRLIDTTGTIRHWDEKDIVLGDVRFTVDKSA